MSSSSLAQGELIAERYQVTRLIGSGGMGEVYEAWDLLLKEDVALKTLRADLTHKESVVLRFQKEIQLARRVTHPNVCRIFEVGIRPGDARHRHLLFFAMELLKGETLSARIRKGKLTRSEAFPIAVQLAEGLEAAHRVGVVHSDFKSGNIILVPMQGKTRAVITDFGLARMGPNWISSDETDTQTEDLQMAGTVATMSPEQMTGGAITAASDIYSLGIVLYEMATGGLPFHNRHVLQSAMQRGDRQSVSVRSKVPDIDPRWEAAIARCLQRDPADRFASAGEIANWFREGAWQNPKYWTRREWIRNSAAAVITLAIGTEGWLWWHRPYRPLPEALKWYDDGVAALHSMTYETAKKMFLEAVSKDPSFALAHASLARAYDELDSTDKANDSMGRAVTISNRIRLSSDDARKLEAIRLMVSRDYENALPLFKEIEKRATKSVMSAAALETGWLAQQHDETEAAMEAYERALKWDPNYAAAKLRMAVMFGRALKDDEASVFFREAQRLYEAKSDGEGVTETLFQRANLLNRRNLSAKAMAVIEEALTKTPAGNPYQEIRLKLLKSVVYGKLRDTENAIQLAVASIKQADDETMDNLAIGGYIDLGGIYLSAGSLKLAEESFGEGLKRARQGKWPRNTVRAELSLGSLYEFTQRPQDARKIVLDARRFYSKSGYLRESIQGGIILGNVLRQLGEFDEGIKILNDALPSASQLKDPRSEAQLRERLALNLRDRGDWLRALEEYRLAANIFDANGVSAVEALVGLAGLHWRLGRQQESQESLMEAQQSEAKNKDRSQLPLIEVLKAEIAYSEGNLGKALTLSKSLSEAGVSEELNRQSLLLRSLISIRSGNVISGRNSAAALIQELEKFSLVGDAASARLATAEALAIAGEKIAALKFTIDALNFFASKKIWEAQFRSHVVAARVLPQHSTDSESHCDAARTARAQLSSVWTEADAARYLARPDIQRLSKGLHL